MTEVISKSKLEEEDAKNIIIGLLKSGDIYEPRKGKLKVLD
jgi:DNA replicative helicase MCM subunit Mcm2 (Cdc46/Mcm family)